MSKSRSATPKPTTFPSANTSPSTGSTTSRPRLHENTPSGHFYEGRGQQSRSRPVPPHSFHHPPPDPSSRASSSLARSAETSVANHPMAKRPRRESPRTRHSSGSPSSGSQDGTADTEADTGRNQQSEAPRTPAGPQPKKKRTRTLTTPHQSAVLHALLAQSRFPTTAMREEVGRSIGLSARKVQIWFQNQRQKARRPRSQSDISRLPPQHGHFPTSSDPSGINPFSLPPEQGTSSGITQLGHARVRGFEEDHYVYSGHQPSGSFASSSNSPSQLSGPGVPGLDYRPYQEPLGTVSASTHRPDSLPSTHRPYTNPSPHVVRSNTPSSSRPTTGRLHDREFSRTLPPLDFGSLRSRGTVTGLHNVHIPPSLLPAMPPYHFSRSLMPAEPSFVHQSPSLVLPPPYAMQPAPQWDNSLPTPLRLEPLAGSRLGSRSMGVPLPGCMDTQTVQREEVASHVGPAAPSRSGRYDPVRAAFIQTTSTEPLPSLAQETDSDSDVGDDRNRP